MQSPDFDCIVIGSGAGGLSAALCLAREGQRVLVLEQHDVPGGWCHSFQLNGQRFSPGVHYIGLIEENESTNLLYCGLGIANDLVFFRMNPKGFEHCIIGNERVDIPAGIENLISSLSERFSAEKKQIRKYLKLVQTVSQELHLIGRMKTFWDHLTIVYRTRHMGKYGLFTLKRVMGWFLKDPLLKAVLNVQCGDHGLPPFRASFPVHCAVMGHYFNGAGYPMGGGAAIVKAMTNGIKKYQGEIRTQQRVAKILLDRGTAVGVEMADGSKIYAKTILSNADPSTTYLDFIGRDNISKKLSKKLDGTRYSVTSLILFLTLEMDVREAGLDSGNIWQLRDADLDGIYNSLTKEQIDEGEEIPALFISCTTLKDPASFDGRHHNFEIVTFISYECFKEFNTGEEHHGQAYTEFKERIISKMLNNLEKVLPGAKSNIVHLELGTPKTNEFYINSTNGNVYGTEKTITQVGPFSFGHKSEIKNLYLCGASTLSHGVGGASYSGVAAAAVILGCKPEELIKPMPDQFLRIYDAEDASTWPEFVRKKIEVKSRRSKMVVSEKLS